MHEVCLERAAERDLRRLPTTEFRRVVQAIKALAHNPRPPGRRKLSGTQNDWRIRVGDYRVLYEIDDAAGAVRVMRVRHRQRAYG